MAKNKDNKETKENKIKNIVYHCSYVFAGLTLIAFALTLGLGAPWGASVAMACLSIAGWVVAGCLGYSLRFKKNWDKDKTPAGEYLKPDWKHRHDAEEAELENNSEDTKEEK